VERDALGRRIWLELPLDLGGVELAALGPVPRVVAVDWHEIAGICEEAYRVVAPKRLVAVLDRTDPNLTP